MKSSRLFSNSTKNEEMPTHLLEFYPPKNELNIVQPLPEEAAGFNAGSQPIDDAAKELSNNKAEALYDWLSDSLIGSSESDLSTKMQTHFASEAVDVFWAEEQEARIQNIFNVNTDLSGIALKETSCRSTQCRLSIAITDMDQANNLVELVSSAIQDEKAYYTVIAIPDEQVGVTKIYISKDVNSVAFH